MMDLYKQLKKFGKVKLNEPLSKHTTFKIGGSADMFIAVESTDNLVELLKFVSENNVNHYILGGGSNSLVSDERFAGLAIKVDNKEMKIDGERVVVDAGYPTAGVAQETMKVGLSGFEWGVAVPGTIGGATCGNAGAVGSDMKDSIEKVEVLRDGEVIELSGDECKFGYRDSIFKHNNDLILKVHLKLEKNEGKELMKKAMDHITHRNKTQPQGHPSAGCVFKNFKLNDKSAEEIEKLKELGVPEEFIAKGEISAGWIIQHSGMDGVKDGDAEVSSKHCNFIVNNNKAKAENVVNLIEQIKEKVYDKFGINLEEEMRYINFN